jgi:hypothetical protein
MLTIISKHHVIVCTRVVKRFVENSVYTSRGRAIYTYLSMSLGKWGRSIYIHAGLEDSCTKMTEALVFDQVDNRAISTLGPIREVPTGT